MQRTRQRTTRPARFLARNRRMGQPRPSGLICSACRGLSSHKMAEQFGRRSPLHAGQSARLREIGYDEIWLQNWLSEDPSRLGLGDINVLAQELSSPRGGSLDILAAEGDTYYSIEVQLGEVDASHGFRVFDYWARNRARYPDKTHVAVLVAESAAGRYREALSALVEFLPLIVIELRIWRGAGEAVLVPEVAFTNASLDIGGTAAASAGGRTEEDWKAECSEEAWRFHKEFVQWASENLGDIRVDYNPKSYIGVRRGRRVWAPLWFRQDGATVYLADPDGVKGEEPSVAFEELREQLRDVGLEPAWQRTYDAGAHPVVVRLRRDDIPKPAVQELLRASFEILEHGAIPWSERHAAIARGSAAPADPGDGAASAPAP